MRDAGIRSKDRDGQLFRRAVTASSDQASRGGDVRVYKGEKLEQPTVRKVLPWELVDRLVANDSIPRAPIAAVFSFKRSDDDDLSQ